MKSTATTSAAEPSAPVFSPPQLCVGSVAQITSNGQVWVDFPGNPGGITPARLALAASEDIQLEAQVLLTFDQQQRSTPIIVGLVRDTVAARPLADASRGGCENETGEATETYIDGRRIVLEGQEEVVLRCGKGSITLRRDGKIVIKGTQLVNRATGVNRIKGATVVVN